MCAARRNYFSTTAAIDCLPITHDANRVLREQSVKQGVLVLLVPAPGAGLRVMDALPEVRAALVAYLTQLAEPYAQAATDRRKQSFSVAARLQSALLGRSLSLPILDGAIPLASGSDIFLIDCEPQAGRREVIFTVLSGDAAAGGGGRAAPGGADGA